MGYSRILKNSEFATAEQGVKADTAVQNLADIQAAFNSGTILEKNEFKSSLGEVYYRDEAGALWCAESWMREDGEVFTTDVEIEPVQDTLLE